MKNLIIFGGRGNGTVLLNTIYDINDFDNIEHFNVIGFVNNQHESVSIIEDVPVLGNIEHLQNLLIKHDAFFINCISSASTMNFVENLFEKEYKHINNRLISVIHPTALICANVKIGDGCFIGPQNYIGQNTKIGNHCFIHSQCYVARDSVLSNYDYLAPKVYIGAEVKVQKSVYFGAGALVKERVYVGENSIIGMGSVIIDDVDSNCRYYGEKAIKRD